MSMTKKTLISLVLVTTMFASTAGFAKKPSDRVTIVDVAAAVAGGESGEFSSLVAALGAYPEIKDVLDGNGQFTVFAPTNEAFDKLNSLLAAAFCFDDVFALASDQPNYVADVLLYHVARGRMDSGDVLPKDQIRMLSRDFLVRDPGSLGLTDVLGRTATIDAANWLDVMTDNGVIHGIDEVVLPYAPMTNCPL